LVGGSEADISVASERVGQHHLLGNRRVGITDASD
jgi:hypothetical protein